jgi:predicted DNA-binding helix-hairpin-helix protein
MERLVRVAKKLRTEHNFNGYITSNPFPGERRPDAGSGPVRRPPERKRGAAHRTEPQEAGPRKEHGRDHQADDVHPKAIEENRNELQVFRKAPQFVPAGQSTQMIIGASPETDRQIMQQAEGLYQGFGLKRVYYSAYVPVLDDGRLPGLHTLPPVQRENRLYQTDWLLRFYGFKADEILDDQHPNLETDIDPKLSWALRNLHLLPVDINAADYAMILRIPGWA